MYKCKKKSFKPKINTKESSASNKYFELNTLKNGSNVTPARAADTGNQVNVALVWRIWCDLLHVLYDLVAAISKRI